MPTLLNLAPRTIGVRQLMIAIAFLGLLLALWLQTWRAAERETRLTAQLQSVQYELQNLRMRLITEAQLQEEVRKRFPNGTATTAIASPVSGPDVIGSTPSTGLPPSVSP